MKIIDFKIVKQAMDLRTTMLHEERDIIKSKPELKNEAILIAARNKVAKKYKYIADTLKMPVIFNSGGAQTKRMKELDTKDVDYIWVEPKHLTKEEDIINGF